MKKFRLRVAPWAMLLAMLLSSSVGTVAFAADAVVLTATAKKNP